MRVFTFLRLIESIVVVSNYEKFLVDILQRVLKEVTYEGLEVYANPVELDGVSFSLPGFEL